MKNLPVAIGSAGVLHLTSLNIRLNQACTCVHCAELPATFFFMCSKFAATQADFNWSEGEHLPLVETQTQSDSQLTRKLKIL